MEAFIIYLLKSAAVLAIFFFGYQLFLKRETFFSGNRHFLLGGILAALLLPFVIFTKYIYVDPLIKVVPYAQETVSGLSQPTQIAETFTSQPIISDPSFTIDWWQVGLFIYLAGVVILSIRFLLQCVSLIKLFNAHTSKRDSQYKHVITKQELSPFSFFNYIIYNPSLYTEEELKTILEHEKVHCKQWHSIDIIIAELAFIFQWINPVAWFYKKSIQQNLEFIADNQAVQGIDSSKQYQHTLLKVSLQPYCTSITNNFFNSLIKKRIVMLNQKASKRRHLWKFGIVLPALALFLFSFNVNEVYKVNEIKSFTIDGTTTNVELNDIEQYFNERIDGFELKLTDRKRNTEGKLTDLSVATKFAGHELFDKNFTFKGNQTKVIPAMNLWFNEDTMQFYADDLDGGDSFRVDNAMVYVDVKEEAPIQDITPEVPDTPETHESHETHETLETTEAPEAPETPETKSEAEQVPTFKSPISPSKLKKVSSTFGRLKDPKGSGEKFHNGVDFVAPKGTAVMASASGKVVQAEMNGKYGNSVQILHKNGYSTHYNHLKDYVVKEGDMVTSRDLIGHVGNTGLANGPHLHFEIRKDDEPLDPMKYLQANTLKVTKTSFDNGVVAGNIEVIIDKNTSEEKLKDIQRELKKKDVSFSYSKLAYNDNDEIIRISIEVKVKRDGNTTTNKSTIDGDGQPIETIYIRFDEEANFLSINSGGQPHSHYNYSGSASGQGSNSYYKVKGKVHAQSGHDDGDVHSIEIIKADGEEKIMVNGKVVTRDELKKMDVHVVETQDENGQNVIRIKETKDGHHIKAEGQSSTFKISVDDDDYQQGRIYIHSSDDDEGLQIETGGEKPLIIIDGKEVPYKKLKKLDTNKIESINVLKGASAKKLYGKKGENGVLVITTKKDK